MNLLIGLLTAFAAGFLSKLTDVQVDEKRFLFKNLKFATGIAYGIAFALIMQFNRAFANLFLGIAVAVLLAGKVDSKAHQFAVAGFLLAIALLGTQAVDFALLLAFVFFALLDEFLNDHFDVHPSKGFVALIAKQRLSLEAFSFALSAYTGEWLYFAGIIFFDAGYWLAERFSKKFFLKIPGAQGTHLILDLLDCPSAKLSSAGFVEKFLKETPGALGMRAISKPVVKEVKTVLDEGLSGFIMIAESHVSIHTFPKLHSAHVDVFSCKPFSVEKARLEIERRFSAGGSKARVLERMGE